MDQNSFNEDLTNVELNGYAVDSQYAVDLLYPKAVASQTPLSTITIWLNQREQPAFPISKNFVIERLMHYGKDVTALNNL